MVLRQDVVHLLDFLIKVFIEYAGHLERFLLPISLSSFCLDGEHRVLVQLKRVKQTQFGLSERFIEVFEVGFDHDEIQRAIEAIFVVSFLKTLHFLTQVIPQVIYELQQVFLEHFGHVRFLAVRIRLQICNAMQTIVINVGKEIGKEPFNFINDPVFLAILIHFIIQNYAHEHLIAILTINFLS